MNEQEQRDTYLEQALRDHYRESYGEPPAPAQVWARLVPHLVPQESDPMAAVPQEAHRAWWQRAWPVAMPRRLAAACVAMLAVLALGGGVYALTGGLDHVLHSDPGAQQAALADLGRPFDLARSADGFTVTLRWAYADANRVIVGYTVAGPEGRHFLRLDAMLAGQNDLRPTITDAQGRVLPMESGVLPGLYPQDVGQLTSFDAAALVGQSGEVALRLTLPELRVVEQIDPQAPARQFTVLGPFAFDFVVPFQAGRVATPRQTITANGSALTLERVVVTPSETRLYLSGPMLAQWAARGGVPSDGPKVFLHAPGVKVLGLGSHRMGEPGWLEQPQGDEVVVHYPVALVEQREDWTVEVRPRLPDDPLAPGGSPWTFQFSMP
jgi:hypothetical protein